MTYDRRRQGLMGVALALGYSGLWLSALLGAAGVTVAMGATIVVLEFMVWRRCDQLAGFLGAVGASTATRCLWRDLAVSVATLRYLDAVRPAGPVLGLVAGLYLVALGKRAASAVVSRRHTLPVETRNLDLSGLRLPAPPPDWAAGYGRVQILNLNVLLLPAALVAQATHTATPLVVAGSATTMVGLVMLLAVLPGLVRSVRMPPPAQIVAEVGRALRAYRPLVALHQAGGPECLYQLRMWLPPMAATGVRHVVVVRNRATMASLPPLRCPVVCVPHGSDLIALGLPTVRAAFYPAHAGSNIHLLRDAGMRHVFLGHGDSDKPASVNPYSKVYDEVWVAGPAGRERYRRAAVGVPDADVVEVGRPQLGPVHSGARSGARWAGGHGDQAPPQPLTVLYAPTWEGWGDDRHHTSLEVAGELVVSLLLGSPTPVRVIYRPHPLTGTRSARTAAAHRRIVAMLENPAWPARRASTRLREVASSVLTWVAVARSGDAGEVPAPPDGHRPAHRRPGPAGAAGLNGAAGPTGHVVVIGDRPALYDCFQPADLLIADVSSVVSDWIHSGKPYVVVNTRGTTEAEFRAAFPAAGAAYLVDAAFLVDAGCGELEKVLRLVREGNDPMAPAREELRRHLLGPDEPPAQQRFAAQVARVVAGRPAGGWRALEQPGPVDPPGAPDPLSAAVPWRSATLPSAVRRSRTPYRVG